MEDMQALVSHSTRVMGRVWLDWHAFLDLLHELEESLPKEYQDAQAMLRDAESSSLQLRRRIEDEREQSRAEASRMLEEASQRARALASEHEIGRLAEERAADLRRESDDYSRLVRDEAESYAGEVRRTSEEYSESTRRSADEYALTLLSHLKAVVSRAQASVEDGLQQIKK